MRHMIERYMSLPCRNIGAPWEPGLPSSSENPGSDANRPLVHGDRIRKQHMERAYAAALSSLQMFPRFFKSNIDPAGTCVEVVATLPNDLEARDRIIEALQFLQFEGARDGDIIGKTSGFEVLALGSGKLMTTAKEIVKQPDTTSLLFTKEGIERLIKSGGRNPVLEAVADALYIDMPRAARRPGR